jgi:hypothetical protein
VWHSYQEGRLLVSLGLLANITVNERFRVGDLATGLGKTFKVRAGVSGPSWVTADRVSLYANGILIRDSAILEAEGKRGGEKTSITWEVPKPPHDVHLVVIATGPGVTAPYWEIPRPYQPNSRDFKPKVIGSTNPVWIDADGDGKFQSARDYAGVLVREAAGNEAKLKASLARYDESVAVQARALTQPEGPSPSPGTPGTE